MTPTVLTGQQMAQVLGISPCTMRVLAKTYDVPRIRRNNNRPLFNPEAVSACLAERLESGEDAVKTWRAALYRRYPEVVERVQALDKAISAGKERRGYSLSMVPNKRHGFFYYVRYYDRGAMVPSRWSTGTNERSLAEAFAKKQRERLLATYHEKRGRDGLLSVFENYYRKDSACLEIDRRRHRTLCEQNRRAAYNFITKVFIPFLKEENAVTFSGVTPSLLTKFQDRLLSGGNIPVTVNRNMRLVRRVFSHLVSRGGLAENPCDKVTPIPDVPDTHKARGCYELDSLKGVFDEEWEDKTSYLLCLLMYGTNLRNCEIRRLKGEHIAAVEDCHFIDVRVSKTRNGVRHRPLHEFIRVKLAGYMAERGIEPDEYVFSHLSGRVFRKAYLTMGERLGKSGDDLKAENISFYSGRHFWKTLMNAGNLGEDAEEYWMGHAVSGDVAKTYNHRDKQGREVMLGKTREAFAILDRYLFGAPEAG